MTGAVTEIIDLKDVVWAMMVYFVLRIVFTGWSIKKVAIIGALFSFMIEVSQLYHDEWIDELRRTWFGELMLGSAFVWGDLIAYLCGIGLAVIVDHFVKSYS